MPNIQKEAVSNTINKAIKRGKKKPLGVIKHWLPRETNICVGAQSQLDSHMQNHLPSKMDITFKLVLLQMGSWTK